MKNLLEDQLQKELDYYKIGKELQKAKLKKIQKLEKENYFMNQTNQTKLKNYQVFLQYQKIRAAQKVFDKVIK